MLAYGEGSPLPGYIKAWFYLDIILALAPPVYWLANQPDIQLFGLPIPLVYFVATALCVSLSIVCAYFCDPGIE